jgi:hypothetical protein
MTETGDVVRVAIAQIPDIHLFPRWDRQFQVEYPISLEVQRVHSRRVLELLRDGRDGPPCDIGIVAEEPSLTEFPQEQYERVVVGADTVSLVVQSADSHEEIATLRDEAAYLTRQQLIALLTSLDTHELLMLEPGGGLNLYVAQELLGGRVVDGRVGPGGCRVSELAVTNEALVGALLADTPRLSIVTNTALRSVELPRDRITVLPVIDAPLRLFYMLRRRVAAAGGAGDGAVQALWDFLLDFIGAYRGASQLGTDLSPSPPRSEAVLVGIDIVDFSLLPEEHQRTAVRLLNSVTQQIVASVEPVRRRIRKAISTGDGLILVIDGEADAKPLFDMTVALHKAITQLLATLGASVAAREGIAARMAIHAGPVLTVHDPNGDLNFVGPGVNDLRRILDFGDADHILASAAAHARLRSAPGFVDRPDSQWTGWDKHGIQHEVHSVWGDGFGKRERSARLDARPAAPSESGR